MNQELEMTYDLIIIGLGPAGLTASIYASRYRLKNLIIGEIVGGELAKAHKVENLPGFLSLSGLDWGQKTREQAEKLGAETIISRVGRIEKSASGFKIFTEDQKTYQAKTLIMATGSERRKLDIPGEKEYLGRGISYCTTCDAPFFRDKTVALIGGSDSAVSGAAHTAEYAYKVYIIYRGEQLRAEPIWREQWQAIEKSGRGETIYKTNIVRILGGPEFAKLKTTAQSANLEEKNQVIAVELDKPYQNSQYLLVDGVFIEIGGVPGTALLKALGVKLTATGHVQVSETMTTNLPGLFSAGDMTDRSAVLAQAITAMAQGAMAAASAYKFLKGAKAPRILGV